jgi:sugar phosphate isomerase/epimerase
MGFAVEVRKGKLTFFSRFPWRLGIVLFMAYPSLQKNEDNLDEALSFILQDGFFDRVEIHKISNIGWNRNRELLRGVNVARGFQLDVMVGNQNVSAEEEEKRRQAVDYVKSEIDIEVKRGISEFALCSGPATQDSEKSTRQLVVSLGEIANHASKYSATVYLETFDVDKDKRQILGTIDQAASVLREIKRNSPNIFLMWDQSHAPLLGEEPETLVEYSDLIGAIHIGCGFIGANGLRDWHPVYHAPGALNEEKDVARLFEVLLEMGYRGPISAEIKPQEGQTPEEVINSAKGAIYSSYALFLKRAL